MPRATDSPYPHLCVDGVRHEYRYIVGDNSLPTLVLLHEGLGCVALWRDFPERLASATGRSVFAYSRAGYGGSAPIPLPRPLEYMSIEATEVLPTLLNAAQVSQYTLIGHSDGATIALVYAGRNVDPGLQSVIVLAPHVFAEQCGIDAITKIEKTYRDGDLRRRLKKYHGQNVECAFRGWCDTWLNSSFMSWSIESELAGISVPVLQIQGRDDEYGTIEQLSRIEEQVDATVETVLFDDCGHSPHAERTTDTLAVIVNFCR